jgi:hypothetical protein
MIDYIAYGYIDLSFGCEFDTEFSPSVAGGEGNPPGITFLEHTSYLRNGIMTAIPDHNGVSTFKPMQDGGVSVATGEWYCVTVL